MTEIIEYETIRLGDYYHRVTVTQRPSKLAAWLGAKPVVRVFVNSMSFNPGEVGWYEVPTMRELGCLGPLARRIGRHIRRVKFAEAVSVEIGP